MEFFQLRVEAMVVRTRSSSNLSGISLQAGRLPTLDGSQVHRMQNAAGRGSVIRFGSTRRRGQRPRDEDSLADRAQEDEILSIR